MSDGEDGQTCASWSLPRQVIDWEELEAGVEDGKGERARIEYDGGEA